MPEGTLDPPRSLWRSLRFLGPGLILSASVVGSGELIATTVLGAQNGFTLLWLILLGCLLKVTIQLEFGRACITHGRATLELWNGRVGAPVAMSVWAAGAFLLAMIGGQGGVLGSAAGVAVQALGTPKAATLIVLALGVALMVFHGRYGPIEWIALLLNIVFVGVVVACVAGVQRTRYAFGWADLFDFGMPADLMVAAAAFGITGVASGEIVQYPYWCLEKGYAKWTGPADSSEDWVRRARGWIRVMTLDALLSMVVYTVSTVCFYLLGASILHAQTVPVTKDNLLQELPKIFTEVMGSGWVAVFFVGAFAVLYSTVLANCAGFSRLWADLFRVAGWVGESRRGRALAIMAFLLPAGWALAAWRWKAVDLVIVNGLANTVFLVVVAAQGVRLRTRLTDPRLRPTLLYDLLLAASIASLLLMAVQTTVDTFFK